MKCMERWLFCRHSINTIVTTNMAKVNIDPRITNISIDSCAFDPKYSPEDQSSLELFNLNEKEQIILLVAHSTLKEVDHPNTPDWVKSEARTKLMTIDVSLTPHEQQQKNKLILILTGNGKRSNHIQDAENVFEAAKYGSYFVTTDSNISKKGKQITVLTNLVILKPSEMVNIYNEFSRT
jgi:hypothetical protein